MPILPQLEDDLRAASQRTLAASSSRPRWRLAVSYLPALGVVAVSLAVAAVVVFSVRSGSERASLPRKAAAQQGLSGPLVVNFAVLRRPQTKADIQPRLIPLVVAGEIYSPAALQKYHCAGQRLVATPSMRKVALPATFLARQDYPQLECQLMRVVQIPQWHARALIAPVTFRANPHSTVRSQGVSVVLDDPVGGTTGTTGPSAGVSGLDLDLRGGINVFENGPNGTSHGIILIPDGVTKVVLDDIRLSSDGAPKNAAAPARQTLAAIRTTANVTSNLAEFSFPMPTVTIKGSLFTSRHSGNGRAPTARQNDLVGVNASGRETWLNAAGQVVRRSQVDLGLLLRVHSLNR